MTVQEAIDVFEKPSDHIKTIQINHVTGIVYSADLVKAFEMAIEALEKQIPKKIEVWNGQASCPCCKKLFGSMETVKKLVHWEMPYCKYCGQALDWKVE